MKQWQALKTVFPELITENFDFIDYQESPSRLDYRLEEREYMSREDYLKGTKEPWFCGRECCTGLPHPWQSSLSPCQAQEVD